MAFSPTCMPRTPSSHPLITCPTPSLNVNGLFLFLELSNFWPLVRVPVKCTVMVFPFSATPFEASPACVICLMSAIAVVKEANT